jgi:hypothetical protein
MAGLFLTITMFFIEAAESLGMSDMAAGGFALEMIGLWMDLGAMFFSILDEETRHNAENMNLPPATLDEQRRLACDNYQWSLRFQAVGLIILSIGAVLSFEVPGLLILGILWAIAGTMLFSRAWSDPPPQCDPWSGYRP